MPGGGTPRRSCQRREAGLPLQNSRSLRTVTMEPTIELAKNEGLNESELRVAAQIIEERADEIRIAWREHFDG